MVANLATICFYINLLKVLLRIIKSAKTSIETDE